MNTKSITTVNTINNGHKDTINDKPWYVLEVYRFIVRLVKWVCVHHTTVQINNERNAYSILEIMFNF